MIKIIYPEEFLLDGNVWVCGDLHGFHKNIAKGTSSWKSGFRDFQNEDEMTKQITDNINSVVKENDYIIHGGDFSFGTRDKYFRTREMIKCKNIINLNGNHDRKFNKDKDLQKFFIRSYDYIEIIVNKILVCMFHFPIESWSQMGQGSVMIHFHCHNNLKHKINRRKDCGFDTNNLFPYLLKDVVDELSKEEISKVDHH